MHWADNGRMNLHYRREGSGPPMVLVHELGGTLHSWDAVVPALRDRFAVTRFDQRGAGQSEKCSSPFSFDDLVDDLGVIVDRAAGAGQPVHMVGAAMGAATALVFASRFPACVDSLTLISPAVYLTEASATFTAARANEARENGMRSVTERSLARAWPPELRGDADVFANYRGRYLANCPQSYAFHNEALLQFRLSSVDLRALGRTLVLAGRRDIVRPPIEVQTFASLLNVAEFDTVDAAHFVALQAPGALADRLNAFLSAGSVNLVAGEALR